MTADKKKKKLLSTACLLYYSFILAPRLENYRRTPLAGAQKYVLLIGLHFPALQRIRAECLSLNYLCRKKNKNTISFSNFTETMCIPRWRIRPNYYRDDCNFRD